LATKLTQRVTLTPLNNLRLNNLCGPLDEHLRIIERHLGVEISNRGNDFEIIGIPMSVDKAGQVLQHLYHDTEQKEITKNDVQLLLKSMDQEYQHSEEKIKLKLDQSALHLKGMTVRPRTRNQRHYLKAIQDFDINFGIGPSGTGKTFLAVACAVAALEKEQVSRIVLVRPAVEAGESLGFLPGDLAQKVDPYLRPLYDALYEMLGVDNTRRLIEKGVIEIAPLAFMRGRTLNDSFIILDEGQNTTIDQMRMFLTRIGFGSKAVITGDITQVDLQKNIQSGLRHAITLLRDIEAIQLTFFTADDVVRHPLVQQIIEAYEKQDQD